MNTTRLTILIALSILFSGCIGSDPICEQPYILHDTGCCLDVNNDSICDTDKQPTTTSQSTSTTTIATTTIPQLIEYHTSSRFQVYTNCPSNGIRLNYPSNWIRSEGGQDTIVSFIAPTDDDSDQFPEKIILTSIDHGRSYQPSLSEFEEYIRESYIVDYSDYTLLSSTENMINHKTSYILKSSYTHSTTEVTILVIGIFSDNQEYILTYISPSIDYDSNIGLINEVINSIEIISF